LGSFYRRIKSRLGPAQAIVATAHNIARIVYRMLDLKVEYHAIGAEEYEKRFREREIKHLPCLTFGLPSPLAKTKGTPKA